MRYRIWVFGFVVSFLFGWPCTSEGVPPIPARIGGTVTVDGTPLTHENDTGCTFSVTRQDGTAYVPAAEDVDGLNPDGWYVINVPIFDGTDQPGGALSGETAIFHVFQEGTELNIDVPVQGLFEVGVSGSVKTLHIEAVSPPLSPTPDIKANTTDGPLTLTQGERVSITISLDPGGKAGQKADWWIAVNTPFDPPGDWYTFVYPPGWFPGINLCAQTGLFSLSPFEVLKMILPVGHYTFYFALDDPNGMATGPWWGLDSVEVRVQ